MSMEINATAPEEEYERIVEEWHGFVVESIREAESDVFPNIDYSSATIEGFDDGEPYHINGVEEGTHSNSAEIAFRLNVPTEMRVELLCATNALKEGYANNEGSFAYDVVKGIENETLSVSANIRLEFDEEDKLKSKLNISAKIADSESYNMINPNLTPDKELFMEKIDVYLKDNGYSLDKLVGDVSQSLHRGITNTQIRDYSAEHPADEKKEKTPKKRDDYER